MALWGALCEFSVQVYGEGDTAPAMAETVGRIVEEGISNAIRHGRATRIEIVVTVASGACNVELTDNGIGPGGGKPGIGSALLHQSSGGAWALTALAQGARLEVAVRS